MWQANYVADLLDEGGYQPELVPIETKGDKIQNVSISKIGSKGVFTEEIEEQLQQGAIDIAVHSAKDMQSQLPAGFELIAFTEREVANDVLVSDDNSISLTDSSKPLRLGTSSARRVATLKHYYPHVETVEIRGNLQTRIRKMREGQCDALLLAYAGVHRMGYDDMIVEKLSMDTFIPAVGQGSVAVEVHESCDVTLRGIFREHLNHTHSETCLLAERGFLRRLEGGCSIPAFAHAILDQEQLHISGGIISLDGQERLVHRLEGTPAHAAQLGKQLANELLAMGGEAILQEIKAQQA